MIICKSDAELGSVSVIHNTPQVWTGELHQMADQYHRSQGAVPSFTGYNGFPASICTSVDEPKVHGTPSNFRLFAMSYDGSICTQELTLAKTSRYSNFCEGEICR